MSYLILNDFKKIIQSDNLNQIIGSDYFILDQLKLAAQSEAISYLVQKYDVSKEFTNSLPYSVTTSYKANQRVYLDAPAYSPLTVYTVNSLTLYLSNAYICTAITTGVFAPASWSLIGIQYTFFYVTLPFAEFNFYKYYLKGDKVYWNNSTYTALQPSVVPIHETLLQGGTYYNAPPINIFPDDINSGIQYWGTPTAYTVAAGVLPTDITKWTLGDNRNQQLVNYCIDIVLYHIHSRIAPRNIPELRVHRYQDAIKWLEGAAEGKYITAAIPILQPKSGGRIRWGGAVKQNNYY